MRLESYDRNKSKCNRILILRCKHENEKVNKNKNHLKHLAICGHSRSICIPLFPHYQAGVFDINIRLEHIDAGEDAEHFNTG